MSETTQHRGIPPEPRPPGPPLDTDTGRETRGGISVGGTPQNPLKWNDSPYSEPLGRIADSLERLVELIEVSMQPTEEADEVLDPNAGLVVVRATTTDGTARSYLVRTDSTGAAIQAACEAWDCPWSDLVEKSVETEE